VIIIESQADGPFQKNGFVVSCPRTRQGVYIDPGDEVEGLLDYIARERIAITHLLLTHAHVDHVTGLPRAKAVLGAPVCLHRDDLFLYERAPQQAWVFGLKMNGDLPPVDHFYTPEDRFVIGDYELRPYHTPGHCPGGVCLAATAFAAATPDRIDLFVGDTLFAGSIGRVDLPGGDYETLIRAIREVLFAFGDAAHVHPGHGPSTTIGQERRTNPFLTGG
jgi:glyoxylase-like metal-dependent hydrolase (beta-lactamase superfamily II)